MCSEQVNPGVRRTKKVVPSDCETSREVGKLVSRTRKAQVSFSRGSSLVRGSRNDELERFPMLGLCTEKHKLE